MPTTRKKIIKTVYKDEAETEDENGDFSDSGSDAKISEAPTSDDDEIIEEDAGSSDDDIRVSKKNKIKLIDKPPIRRRKTKFAKDFVNKINGQVTADADEENELPISHFSVKDLTDADKLLPSFLNLSESDSSDDESQVKSKKKTAATFTSTEEHSFDKDVDSIEYRDVWSSNTQDNSEDIAKKTFLELEKHKTEIEETKASIEHYVSKNHANQNDVSKTSASEFNVDDLLAQGEDIIKEVPVKKKAKARKHRDNSESDIEDWEEVNEAKGIPQQGLQLFVEFPNAINKSKKLDIEMMMKRKINRVKKEHQVYMHQVHVLSWIGHGNYVSHSLNDQEIMAAALTMVPKGCYPEERVTTKYLEQITSWFKDKLTLKQDKNEHKFKPKAPSLKNILLAQIKSRVTTAKKYNVYIFVAMLRALGLQCRVMFNFVTLPIRPPNSELCSLSTKKEDASTSSNKCKEETIEKSAEKVKKSKQKAKCSKKIAQVDGIYDKFSESDSDFDDIMQLDGNDEIQVKARNTRSTRPKKVETNIENDDNKDVSPPKRAKRDATKVSNRRTNEGKAANNTYESAVDNGVKSDVRPEVAKSQKRSVSKINTLEKETTKLHNKVKSKKVSLAVKPQAAPKSLNTTNDKTVENIDKPAPKTRTGRRSISIKDNADVTEKTNSKRNNALETKNKGSKQNQDNFNNTIFAKESTTSSKTLPSMQALNVDNSNNKVVDSVSPRKTISERRDAKTRTVPIDHATKLENIPSILITDENQKKIESKFFSEKTEPTKRMCLSRKRSHTNIVNTVKKNVDTNTKARTRSAPGTSIEKSKYFDGDEVAAKKSKLNTRQTKKEQIQEDKLRVSHRDLKNKSKPKNDVTEDLVDIIKNRIKEEKAEAKKGIVKGKQNNESDEDSDFLPVEDPIIQSDSDENFKPTKISPRPPKLASKMAKKLDRRVLSSDEEIIKQNKVNVWCEVFVEELEQWIAVDVFKGKVHCTNDLYTNSTHPVCYIVGWDNNNYLKDLTRRYVPHWNTVTRKQRAGPEWWRKAVQPWIGPKTARDKEEDEHLDRMQLEAPLPKSIAEYKNHPLYALKRHLLKFEALYPLDAATLGFVRGEAVYSRDCVYICHSRDKWLRDAKVVRLGEHPYKIVKARPKWDKLSQKCITDKPLELFGPWQVRDYEPPTAENGIVPRNPYGNVELFKLCMLPKKTVHIKLPGLQKVAKNLNIDCAPAMTGFDYSGGYVHPVYDGYVVCEEYEEIITEAWLKDQEEQERKELEKIELRVYGNWKHLIRGLMIRERLKLKYGFEEPTTSQPRQPKPNKGPRLVVKKK